MSPALRIAAALIAFATAFAAGAQTYPSRPIRIVIPFSPGGFADVPGRVLAQKLSEQVGQPVIVENKPGAGATIGADFVAKSKPDGYTLLLVSSTHVIGPWLYKSLPYDALKDFEPVAKFAEGPYVLVVHPSLGVQSVPELVAAARARPGKIDYVSSGNGSTQHLVTALFATMAGAPLNHVPYKGSGQAMQDLSGGQVKLGFVGMPNALPHVKAGRLKPLAVSSARRHPDLPDVPSIAEAGVPGFDATLWLGLLAPAGTPPEVVAKLQAATVRALADAEAQRGFQSSGVDVATSDPQAFGALLRAEHEKWGQVVRETGATIN
jgi:tripartite-type tricarboxylate transporter receptor subunit TctC